MSPGGPVFNQDEDGDFCRAGWKVIQYQASEGYGPSVFKLLLKKPATDPTITTSGSLSEFSSEPGVYSEVQSYVVSGVNLEGDITITSPADFEISLTGVDGWVANPSFLTLSPDGGGAVSSTEIFVRFYRSGEGYSSGNITPSAQTLHRSMSV